VVRWKSVAEIVVVGQSLRRHNLKHVCSYINRKETKILVHKSDSGDLLFPLNALLYLSNCLSCHGCCVSLIGIIIIVHMPSRSCDCSNDSSYLQSDNICHTPLYLCLTVYIC
jgi:hypothetical protein